MKITSHKLLPTALACLMIVAISGNACAQRHDKNNSNSAEITNQAIKKITRDNSLRFQCNISHTEWEPGKETMVEFSSFPTTLSEWKFQQKTLGKEPQGAVALQVMAFELYRHNRADGEHALRLNNTSTNYNSTVERLKEIMGKDKYYARPYIAWAMLRGATPENGYTVHPPYTIDMKVDPNKRYQESQLLHGTVIYLLINSKGWDTNWRGVEVVKPQGSDYYVVSNCPAMYTQCKEAKK